MQAAHRAVSVREQYKYGFAVDEMDCVQQFFPQLAWSLVWTQDSRWCPIDIYNIDDSPNLYKSVFVTSYYHDR